MPSSSPHGWVDGLLTKGTPLPFPAVNRIARNGHLPDFTGFLQPTATFFTPFLPPLSQPLIQRRRFYCFLDTNQPAKIKKEVYYTLYSLSFLIAGYAMYINSIHENDRISFGVGTATGATYSTMLIGIVSGVLILYTKLILLFLLNSCAVLYVLALTNTNQSQPYSCSIICVAALIAI